MNLSNLTKEYIRRFGSSEIYSRGEDYYETGKVTNLEYDGDSDTIEAEVEGNYGDYTVEVYNEGGEIIADCDCPYDGYPCKHVIAVMLEFAENKDKYVKKMAKSKEQENSLKARIAELSKEQLLDMVMDCANKYPDFKNELMVRFTGDKKKVMDTIRKQIDRAFPEPGDSYSEKQISKSLRSIAKQVDSASQDMKIDAYWTMIDRTLKELNEYGISDDVLEDVAIDYMEKIVPLLKGKPEFKQKKQEIIEKLMEYYEWGNCGIVDSVYETVESLLKDKDDYQIVINYLEKKVKSGHSDHYQGLIADLYEQIGDDEASLRILEKNLHYGMDYWRLAEYWIQRDRDDKALEIVKNGLEKGEGRKDELYDYMQKHFEKSKDYDSVLTLLKSKLSDSRFSYVGNDETYKSLMNHYESKNDYTGIANLLRLRLEHERELNFDFYKEAQDKLKEQDWQAFEKKFIDRIKADRFYDELLATIYNYENDTDGLWGVVKKNYELLKEYENRLLSKYTEEYLALYKGAVDKHIKNRGRDNYVLAAQYAERIKNIYCDVLKKPDEWKIYIQVLLNTNKSLRAMQEEFRYLL